LKGSKLKLILTSRAQETPLCNPNWFDETPYTWVSPHFHWKPPFDNVYCWEPLVKKLDSKNHHSKIFAKIPLCKNWHLKTSIHSHSTLETTHVHEKCFQKPPFSNTRLFSKTHLSYQKPLHTHITHVKCLKTRAFSWKFQLHAKTRHGTKLVLWPISVQNPIWPTIYFIFLHPSTLLQVSSPNMPN